MSTSETSHAIIAALGLQPHPEGGYYRETYRSDAILPASALSPDYPASRHAGTAIYYLLTAQDISRWHRVRSDEMWHFYAGDPLELAYISSDGRMTCTQLGNDILGGMIPQTLIPGGAWQAARLSPGGKWGLVGCSVAPGFDFTDFELADVEALCALHSQHVATITQFGMSTHQCEK